MKTEKEQSKKFIVPPYICDQCPDCEGFDVGYSDWSDNEFLWITYHCYDCHNMWKEKIDLIN